MLIMDNISELEAILVFFGLDADTPLTLLEGGTANQLWVLDGLYQKLVLRKRSRKYSNEDWVGFEEDYLNYISSKGIPVPVPLKNAQGQSWILIEGHIYQIYPYLEGEMFTIKELSHVEAAGDFLGTLHRCSRDFTSRYPKILPRYDDPVIAQQTLESNRSMLNHSLNKAEKKILQHIENRLAEIAAAVPEEVYYGLPAITIHGDFHPGNVKFSGKRINALFDFDWISLQPRVRDIIDGLIYFTAVREDDWRGGDILSLVKAGSFHMERILVFLDAYNRSSSVSITAAELKVLPFFILARLINSRVAGLVKIPQSSSGEMLTDGIMESLDWWDNNMNRFILNATAILGIEIVSNSNQPSN